MLGSNDYEYANMHINVIVINLGMNIYVCINYIRIYMYIHVNFVVLNLGMKLQRYEIYSNICMYV